MHDVAFQVTDAAFSCHHRVDYSPTPTGLCAPVIESSLCGPGYQPECRIHAQVLSQPGWCRLVLRAGLLEVQISASTLAQRLRRRLANGNPIVRSLLRGAQFFWPEAAHPALDPGARRGWTPTPPCDPWNRYPRIQDFHRMATQLSMCATILRSSLSVMLVASKSSWRTTQALVDDRRPREASIENRERDPGPAWCDRWPKAWNR